MCRECAGNRAAMGAPPRARVLRERNARTSWDLVEDVCFAARYALPRVVWPRELPTGRAAELLHRYVANEITYRADVADQVTRTPWRLVADGVGDCKSTAVFIGTLSRVAGRRAVLRFVDYTGDGFEHVFAVVDGVPADPLLPYGQEFDYLRSSDVEL